jgi:hypothetical protein
MEDELGTDVDLFAVFFLMGCADSSGEKKTVWEDHRRRNHNWVITLMKNP